VEKERTNALEMATKKTQRRKKKKKSQKIESEIN